eukprot:1586214-Prymnesium_polylepis.1
MEAKLQCELHAVEVCDAPAAHLLPVRGGRGAAARCAWHPVAHGLAQAEDAPRCHPADVARRR